MKARLYYLRRRTGKAAVAIKEKDRAAEIHAQHLAEKAAATKTAEPAAADSKEEADDLPLKTDDTPDCYQLLESKKGNGTVSSPRNPLLHGRGGSRHLRCLYRLQVRLSSSETCRVKPSAPS